MTRPLLSQWTPAPSGYKHVVSVSIGSSKRDSRQETEVLGQKFVLERLGTDGDLRRAGELLAALDGRVDAFGLGGTDLYIVAGDRRYSFRDIARLAANAKVTPLLDGSGLKHTLEREAVRQLESTVHWRGRKTLMVAAVDRFGMAEALSDALADVLYGDIVFTMGLDFPIRSIGTLRRAAHLLLPVTTQLPFQWFYPTGDKQEKSVQGKSTRYYDWAEVIAGDFLLIRRFAPDRLDGKTILTNTTTHEDVEWARNAGVKRLITTTPRLGGRSFGTNVMEAFFVALSGERRALTGSEYLGYIHSVGLRPEITELQEPEPHGKTTTA
ncbi:hypothetical protein [Deinococcus peraridilitoris]|uniref:Quinate 5-dehydrogenase n=1 Tax=Deinococcus peraridilitoris (strain DSM 19664 / LMG 22246 / CIP 109416 / KR-200) TaxID=937777 RepID=K9ZYD8_DEIPD|nr:hypothetical protein [Deinococcus peraridilitoris]AFZ65770.1 hypothetical protein Deipe_0166 [Deinococcus peraridilitoris DSM 19664]